MVRHMRKMPERHRVVVGVPTNAQTEILPNLARPCRKHGNRADVLATEGTARWAMQTRQQKLYGHIELTESAPEKDEDFIFLWVCSFFDKKKSKDQRFLFSSCFILL